MSSKSFHWEKGLGICNLLLLSLLIKRVLFPPLEPRQQQLLLEQLLGERQQPAAAAAQVRVALQLLDREAARPQEPAHPAVVQGHEPRQPERVGRHRARAGACFQPSGQFGVRLCRIGCDGCDGIRE